MPGDRRTPATPGGGQLTVPVKREAGNSFTRKLSVKREAAPHLLLFNIKVKVS